MIPDEEKVHPESKSKLNPNMMYVATPLESIEGTFYNCHLALPKFVKNLPKLQLT